MSYFLNSSLDGSITDLQYLCRIYSINLDLFAPAPDEPSLKKVITVTII